MRDTGRRSDAVAAVVLTAVFGWALAEAGSFPFRSAVFPRVAAGAGLAFSLVLLVREVVPRRRLSLAGADEPLDEEAEFFRTATRAQWWSSLAWAAAFFACLWTAGTAVTVVGFSAVYLRVAARARLLPIAAYVVVSYVWIQLVFVDVLHLQLP